MCAYCIFVLIAYSVFLQYFDTVGWGLLTCKTVAHITYTVLVVTLNCAQLLNQSIVNQCARV